MKEPGFFDRVSQISANTLLTLLLDVYALQFVLKDKKLMPHTIRRSDKILAVATGWAFTEIFLYKVIKLSATQMGEETIKVEIFIDAFSSLLDFVRIIGMTFLVEKLTRRSWKPYSGFLYTMIAVITLASEYCSIEVDRLEGALGQKHQDTLFDNDRNSSLIESKEFKAIIVTGVVVKGATALLSIGANYISPF